MALRRCAPMKPSRGTVIPPEIRAAVRDRDRGCVGPRAGMLGPCWGGLEQDHVRASHATGMKSASELGNLVLLCAVHHRYKTNHGREVRPLLLAYIEGMTR